MWTSTCKFIQVHRYLLWSNESCGRLAYIESEMEKRRGQAALDAKNGKVEPFDPQAELYKVAERYKVEAQKQKEDEEGNVTNSLGMLTSIPEVDLGME